MRPFVVLWLYTWLWQLHNLVEIQNFQSPAWCQICQFLKQLWSLHHMLVVVKELFLDVLEDHLKFEKKFREIMEFYVKSHSFSTWWQGCWCYQSCHEPLFFQKIFSELKHNQPAEHVDGTKDSNESHGWYELIVVHRSP